MPKQDQSKIYDPKFVSDLFDKMSSSYGITNYLSSFGFTEKWRRASIKSLNEDLQGKVVIDMMSGMGELWHSISTDPLVLNAVDISPIMNERALLKSETFKYRINVIEEDILQNSLPDSCADVIISSFGLKTFNHSQLDKLAKEINRLLKPGGKFSLVEISEPKNMLKYPYMFYLNIVIPLIGFFFMGNDNSYKYLGRYCSNFKNCSLFHDYLTNTGLNAKYVSYFWGCATGVVGMKD